MLNRRAYRRAGCIVLTTAFSLFGTTGSAHAGILKSRGNAQAGGSCAQASCFQLESTIAFTTTRDTPGSDPSGHQTKAEAFDAAEIYLMNFPPADPMAAWSPNPRRLTTNTVRDGFGDGFANLSPDGKQVVFDRISTGVCGDTPSDEKTVNNISDLYVMDADGSNQRYLTRGSSATWSPDGKDIAFHASASGTGCPINTNPGAAPTDSDIFVANVDDLLAGTALPVDITNTGNLSEDDADWSVPTTGAPDGRIAFTAHDSGDTGNVFDAAIYVINPDGSDPVVLPKTANEQLATPAWSPDGSRILHECRVHFGMTAFQICVMNADGTNVEQLTYDFSVQNLSPTWSPDGQQIVFGRPLPKVPPIIDNQVMNYQLFTISPTLKPDGTIPDVKEITCAPEQDPNSPGYLGYQPTCPPGVTPTPGINLLAHGGWLRVKS
jgi:Tol biopolymer transport system component